VDTPDLSRFRERSAISSAAIVSSDFDSELKGFMPLKSDDIRNNWVKRFVKKPVQGLCCTLLWSGRIMERQVLVKTMMGDRDDPQKAFAATADGMAYIHGVSEGSFARIESRLEKRYSPCVNCRPQLNRL
jgi:hypothetical protein